VWELVRLAAGDNARIPRKPLHGRNL
jgi:hypothetical protein